MKWIIGFISTAWFCFLAWRYADMCPASSDFRHDYIHERDANGWYVRCIECRKRTPGIDAFKREDVTAWTAHSRHSR